VRNLHSFCAADYRHQWSSSWISGSNPPLVVSYKIDELTMVDLHSGASPLNKNAFLFDIF
jgi:hypothetical protein